MTLKPAVVEPRTQTWHLVGQLVLGLHQWPQVAGMATHNWLLLSTLKSPVSSLFMMLNVLFLPFSLIWPPHTHTLWWLAGPWVTFPFMLLGVVASGCLQPAWASCWRAGLRVACRSAGLCLSSSSHAALCGGRWGVCYGPSERSVGTHTAWHSRMQYKYLSVFLLLYYAAWI